MPKYRIPITVTTYTEVEANNLGDAINSACINNNIEGVNTAFVDSWEVSTCDPIYKDGKEIWNNDDYLYLIDISNQDLEKY